MRTRERWAFLAVAAVLVVVLPTLNALPVGGAGAPPDTMGLRVRLAELLGEEDRWWPAGASAEELSRRLEWIVLQIRVKAEAFFARHPLPRAPIER